MDYRALWLYLPLKGISKESCWLKINKLSLITLSECEIKSDYVLKVSRENFIIGFQVEGGTGKVFLFPSKNTLVSFGNLMKPQYTLISNTCAQFFAALTYCAPLSKYSSYFIYIFKGRTILSFNFFFRKTVNFLFFFGF